MTKVLCFCVLSILLQVGGQNIDGRIILKVRQSIYKAIQYVDQNYKRVNEDCLFGVVFSAAILSDSYYNGQNVMDSSTHAIIQELLRVLEKSIPYIKKQRHWVVEFLLDPKIWSKDLHYKYNNLSVFSKIINYNVLKNIYTYENDKSFFGNLDYCLLDIANITRLVTPQTCFLDKKCWDLYNRDDNISSGYILTHKLLLLQFARYRNCISPENTYEKATRKLCSQIYAEVFNGDYYKQLDGMFDLFLEEVLLCGYEGYSDFLSNPWLLYILKSQRSSGCFSAILTDNLKTKIKRTTNIFEDGCADHTTGIGLAVLSLYYNFIVKEILH